MQFKIEDKSSVKKVLSFEIPKEDVAKELNKAYNDLKKKADVKGFRKGKVPRKVLENRFSKDVHADVAPRLIQEAFFNVIKDISTFFNRINYGSKIIISKNHVRSFFSNVSPGNSHCYPYISFL